MTSCRLKILATAAVFAGAVALTGVPPAWAVDGNDVELNLFELDGNPQDDSTAPNDFDDDSDDWELLFGECPEGVNTNGDFCPPGNSEVFTGILADPADPDDPTIFTGGGSKDIKDISVPGATSNAWLHDMGSTPDKDDITNAFAAAYTVPSDSVVFCLDDDVPPDDHPDGAIGPCGGAFDDGPLHEQGDTIIYFGADRFDNNGDAFLGFWFFQDNISLTEDPLKGGFEFDGVHVPGDLLVLVEFPQGANALPEVKVLQWDPVDADMDNVAKNLDLVLTATDAICDGTGGKIACAITNPEGGPSVPSIWDYTPKGGLLGDAYPFETFYSGGINVTALLSGTSVCFSSFMAETRSSRSETAQLKDFVLGGFPLCGSSAVTIIHEGRKTDNGGDASLHPVIPISSSVAVVGDEVHDFVRITGSILGGGTAPDPSSPADVTFELYSGNNCGATSGSLLDTSTGSLVGNGGGTADAESDFFVLLTTGAHSYLATWPGDDNYPGGAIATCEPFNVIQPELTITKDVNSCLNPETLDSGSFNLQFKLGAGAFATAPGGANLKDGGTTGSFGVPPGNYTVNETAGNKTGGGTTSLDEYVKVFQTSGDCIGGTVTLAGIDSKTCTISNIRKPHLIVKKVIDTSLGAVPDSGLFNLQVNGTTVDSGSVPTDTTHISGDGSDVGNGAAVRLRIDDDGLAGEPADFGNFRVGEVEGSGTTLQDNYQTSILCDDDAGTEAVFTSGAAGTREVTGINLKAGNVVTCTITNKVVPAAAACPVQ